MKRTVHLLVQGRALCDQPGPIFEWPADHKWAGLAERDDVPEADRCPECWRTQAAEEGLAFAKTAASHLYAEEPRLAPIGLPSWEELARAQSRCLAPRADLGGRRGLLSGLLRFLKGIRGRGFRGLPVSGGPQC